MIHEQLVQYSDIIQRVNKIVAQTSPEDVPGQLLSLMSEVSGSQASSLYLYDVVSNSLVLETTLGDSAWNKESGYCVPLENGVLQSSLRLVHRISFPDLIQDPLWSALIGYNESLKHSLPLSGYVCSLPLVVGERFVGVIHTVNPLSEHFDESENCEFLYVLSALFAPHIYRATQILDARRRERRLLDLIDIMSRLSTTLERDQLLDDIMAYAEELLEVEATSIWIKDDATSELVLYVATGERKEHLREVRIPAEQGIIGKVASSTKTIVVNDVDKDVDFYRAVDQQSGFTTRSILCVPLQAPNIDLGGERGELQETIIGGAQALNKRDGRPFCDEDVALFEMLASQAATILQFSELYNQLAQLYNELALLFNETQRLSEQNYKMFWGIIKGISSFIDRKDPYTRGHSMRVSDFSVAIAQQLGLSREMIEHIHIGGILHDVGKIGVPDQVLKKPSHLTEDEMAEMKLHPLHGIQLLKESDLLWLLPIESQAVVEHHERLDGTGYPKGLKGERHDDEDGVDGNSEGISLIGRIVAVADAFDAMTSDRPYRPAMDTDKALSILWEAAGTEFDPQCVDALVRARQAGRIQVQHERDESHHAPRLPEYMVELS